MKLIDEQGSLLPATTMPREAVARVKTAIINHLDSVMWNNDCTELEIEAIATALNLIRATSLYALEDAIDATDAELEDRTLASNRRIRLEERSNAMSMKYEQYEDEALNDACERLNGEQR